jgi:hypothetical protein
LHISQEKKEKEKTRKSCIKKGSHDRPPVNFTRRSYYAALFSDVLAGFLSGVLSEALADSPDSGFELVSVAPVSDSFFLLLPTDFLSLFA